MSVILTAKIISALLSLHASAKVCQDIIDKSDIHSQQISAAGFLQ